MRRWKLSLVYRRLAHGAGPGVMYAIATCPTTESNSAYDCLGAAVEMGVPNGMAAEAFRAAARAAVAELQKKLNGTITTYLTSQTELRDWEVVDALKVFYISPEAAPADLKAAELFADALFAKRLELWKVEFPMIPWESHDLRAHQKTLAAYPNIGQYDVHDPRFAPTWAELQRRRKILLHVCCGPDAAGVINQLKRDFEVVCFWYDPNIQPEAEYQKRLDAFRQVAELEAVPYIVGEYDVDNFFARIKGLEHTPEQGAKCSKCYDMRLERTVLEAKNQSCDLYATTLAISPHKVQEKLIAFGELNEKRYGIPYYHKNFMRDDGFKKSVEYTRDYGIYRQDYCGCIYSMHEGGPQARKKAVEMGLAPASILAEVVASRPVG